MADQLVLFVFSVQKGYFWRNRTSLDFVEGDNIHGLDVVLKAGDLLLEIVHQDLVVLDDARDLELLDAVTDSDEFAGTPEETVHGDRSNALFKFFEWGLIVPGFDIENDVR